MIIKNEQLLLDKDIHQFILDGYVQINSELPKEFHKNIYQKLESVLNDEGNPGNNILPRIPEIQQVFNQPSVRGALTSLLGPGYLMHPHRYCHLNQPGSSGQTWHKDDYIFDHNVRHARCRWVMAFYYPQDVSSEMGPTGILPGMQYFNKISDNDASKSTEEPLSLCGPAGTVSLVNFDSWHRATENLSTKNRYMLKFQFTRSHDPISPSWQNHDPNWPSKTGEILPETSEVVWNWMRGTQNKLNENNIRSIEHSLTDLDNKNERVRIQAAYSFGGKDRTAVKPLIERLRETQEGKVLNNIPKTSANPVGGNPSELPVAYALSALGAPSVSSLKELLKKDDPWWVRATAANILGDIGLPSQNAMPELLHSLADDEPWVRRNTSEAISVIGGFRPDHSPILQKALLDEDERVRRNIAFAIVRHPFQDQSLLDTLLELSTVDPGRYVRYYAQAAIARITARNQNVHFWEAILTNRWCPLTTPKSSF
tara:strand:- start:18195 stop:19646 length:1452 start_codon:yes stop_codon:yes gene_type:complete